MTKTTHFSPPAGQGQRLENAQLLKRSCLLLSVKGLLMSLGGRLSPWPVSVQPWGEHSPTTCTGKTLQSESKEETERVLLLIRGMMVTNDWAVVRGQGLS